LKNDKDKYLEIIKTRIFGKSVFFIGQHQKMGAVRKIRGDNYNVITL